MSSEFNVQQIGARRIVWLETGRVDECIEYMWQCGLDGVGVGFTQGYTDSDLSFIRRHPTLPGLRVAGPRSDFDASLVAEAKELEFLTLSCPLAGLDLREHRELKHFSGTWHPKSCHEAPQLKVLILEGYKPKAKDMTALAVGPGLERLKLVQTTVRVLEGIEAFPELRVVELIRAPQLKSVRALAALKRLQAIECLNCRKVEDWPALAGLPELVSLKLNRCGTIESIEFLEHLPQLREFRFVDTDVVDGNLTPVLRLDGVGFMDKKHYSHKYDEVQRIIAAR